MDCFDYGCAVIAWGFDEFETIGSVIILIILLYSIMDTHIDADGLFVGIGVFRWFNKW